jgi:hypothetical protein
MIISKKFFSDHFKEGIRKGNGTWLALTTVENDRQKSYSPDLFFWGAQSNVNGLPLYYTNWASG